MNQEMNNLSELQEKYSKAVFIYLLIVIGIRFLGGKFLVDFHDQPIRYIDENYLYWLSLLSYFPNYIIHHYWTCVLIDVLVVNLPIICLISTKYRKIWTALFIVIFWVQTSTVEIYSCSHSKSVLCLFLVLMPILFSKNKFLLMVDFVRYAGAFILLSAAYFKYVNGALLKNGNYSIALVNQYFDRAIMNPDHFLYQLASYIIDRPWLGDILFRMLFLSQLLFLLTFFTRKFDKILVINLFAFSALTYVFMGIYNFDIFIIAIPLYFSIQVKNQLRYQDI